MNPRALLLSCTMLVSVAWSQEAARDVSLPSARAFDISSESTQRILASAAAPQSASVTVAEEPPKARANDGQIRFVPVVKKEAPPPAPRRPRRPPPPEEETFLSELIGVILDEALGIEEQSDYELWRDDRSRGSLEDLRQRARTPDEYPPSPLAPKP